jgi:hypothetical protein
MSLSCFPKKKILEIHPRRNLVLPFLLVFKNNNKKVACRSMWAEGQIKTPACVNKLLAKVSASS